MPLRLQLAVACLLASAGSLAAPAQSFFARNQARIEATQAQQPGWATPLVTVSPRTEQGFRTDFIRQSLPGGQTTWNYGGAKGLQFVPLPRVELRFSPPPFLTHSNPSIEDGFGDVAFRIKYRVLSSPEQRRNAIVTAELGATLPTGKSGNGSCCAVLMPALEAGKGFGRFAFTLDPAGSLPVTGARTLGRQITLNEAAQYHATRILWFETEFNSTFYRGGKYDGHEQTFITPGVIFSRMRLFPVHGRGPERVGVTLGAGEQIALTRFKTYNHAPILTARLRF